MEARDLRMSMVSARDQLLKSLKDRWWGGPEFGPIKSLADGEIALTSDNIRLIQQMAILLYLELRLGEDDMVYQENDHEDDCR